MNKAIKNIRQNKPLIHHITNPVTMNDCANITLAIGALPIMATNKEEVSQITSSSDALILNIGVPQKDTVDAMILSGKKANEKGIPIVLDPVGVGVSNYRKEMISLILSNIHVDIIKGNQAEIKEILGISSKFKGVESMEDTCIDKTLEISKQISQITDSVVVTTGVKDTIYYNDNTVILNGGTPFLSNITGTGCMLASLIGSLSSAEKDYVLATKKAIEIMHLAGENAYKTVKSQNKGPGSFKNFLIDEVYNISMYIY